MTSAAEDNKNTSFCSRHLREPCVSFGQRCSRLVKEQRARFYIFRRCVTILLCWHDRGDS
ncbi:hypothetical protein Sjap_013792 [Stephania japonica]|uniref:DEVIL-like protein n=1 Tax=Stephania japonica TaxID=461633 RepID=A0AAP0IZD3_9MAGN